MVPAAFLIYFGDRAMTDGGAMSNLSAKELIESTRVAAETRASLEGSQNPALAASSKEE